METNKKQRIIILVGLIVVVFMFLFPPWVFRYPNNARSNAGYAFIINPPAPGGYGGMVANLDGGRLLIQLLGVSIIIGGAILLLSKKKSKINKEEQETISDRELPLRWFKFYTYVRIPIAIFVAISLIVSIETNPRGLFEIYLMEAMLILMVIYYAILFYALHKRLSLGWMLNWVAIVSDTLIAPIGHAKFLGAYLVAVILMSLVWFLPNYIYFKKRRYFFYLGWGSTQGDKWRKPIILLCCLVVLISGYYIWNSNTFQQKTKRLEDMTDDELHRIAYPNLSIEESLNSRYSHLSSVKDIVESARKSGIPDDQIAEFLSSKHSFDYQGATKAGYSPAEIIDFIVKKAATKNNAADRK